VSQIGTDPELLPPDADPDPTLTSNIAPLSEFILLFLKNISHEKQPPIVYQLCIMLVQFFLIVNVLTDDEQID
jgi:hypothetical protein